MLNDTGGSELRLTCKREQWSKKRAKEIFTHAWDGNEQVFFCRRNILRTAAVQLLEKTKRVYMSRGLGMGSLLRAHPPSGIIF